MRDCVVELGFREVLDALAAINDAIKLGYEVTRGELEAKNYDPRVSKTAFGQALHHNISQGIYNIGENYSEIVTDLPPNRRRTHHHVIALVGRVLFTVSAVKHINGVPRYAAHRSRYALIQSYFRVNADGVFEIVNVPDPYNPSSLYVQILHGPTTDDPQRHAFTVLRLLDVDNHYFPTVIDLEEHLISAETVIANFETVTEDFEITVISPTGASQYENR